MPVTGKIRIGWDQESINAVQVSKILEGSGMQAISIHGRTRSQSYGGQADWNVIDECAHAVSIPVIGNGDILTGEDVEHRKKTTAVSGVMIGRAAMQNPWIFRDAKHYLKTGQQLPPAPLEERWNLIKKHCRRAINWGRYGNENQTLMAMRSRLMAYSKGIPGSKRLRSKLSTVVTMADIENLSIEHMKFHENKAALNEPIALV